MDDRELEARLSTHLHHRFDAAPVPAGLAAAVRQGLENTKRPVGFSFRPRALPLGRVATVAGVVGIAALLFGRILALAPAAPGVSPSPTAGATAVATSPAGVARPFIVLPKAGTNPSKAESDRAGKVLEARLTALGLDSFTTATGYGFELAAPAGGPSDEDVRAVLAAVGTVEFVPLPPDTYGDIDISTLVGKPLPHEESALFGNDGIASVALGSTEQGFPTIDVVFTPAAGAAFGAWTTAHTREYFAIVIDGRVVAAPVINEPITSGQVSITGAAAAPGSLDTAFAIAAAIMVGGQLPEAWHDADVPELIAASVARSKAVERLQLPGNRIDVVRPPELDSRFLVGIPHAVWLVELEGAFVGDCPPELVAASECPPAPSVQVVVDAVTGAILAIGPPGAQSIPGV